MRPRSRTSSRADITTPPSVSASANNRTQIDPREESPIRTQSAYVVGSASLRGSSMRCLSRQDHQGVSCPTPNHGLLQWFSQPSTLFRWHLASNKVTTPGRHRTGSRTRRGSVEWTHRGAHPRRQSGGLGLPGRPIRTGHRSPESGSGRELCLGRPLTARLGFPL